jgi:amino acid adenylation domain-containing protein/thioester reductase-like protein
MNSKENFLSDACFGRESNHSSVMGIDDIFRQQVARCPVAIAAIYGAQEATYAELDRRAFRLAAYLQQRGVRPEEPVGILLEPSLDQIVCQLAVIRAGGSCLPLDPGAPDERIKFMLDDLGVRIVLTSMVGQSRIAVPEVLLIEEENSWPPLSAATDIAADDTRRADHRTHILFTSGTTGRPKAVEVLARGIIRLTVNTSYVTISPNDRFAAIANPAFDASLFEIWGALLNGATTVLLPRQTCIDPRALRHSLHVQGITIMFITTALFNQTVHAYPDAFRGLHQLLFGGEAINLHAVRTMMTAAPPRHALHVYGPTEGTTFSSYHEIRLEEVETGSVPIGKPIDGTQIFILDNELRPIKSGEIGDIYIGGDGVARGYWSRPELNRERFIEADVFADGQTHRLYKTGDLGSHRADGAINFHGRNDNQVKIRGHRIEVEEIEAVLIGSGLLQEAVVLVQQTELGDRYLAAFAVPREKQTTDDTAHQDQGALADQLARYLASRLPAYMRPRLSFVDKLPMNANGKVDRRALAQQYDLLAKASDASTRQHGADAPGDAGGADATEAIIATIWRRALNIETVKSDGDFFALGGDSLQAASLILQLSKHFRYPLPVHILYDNPTPAKLAAYLNDRGKLNGGGLTSVDEMAALRADAQLPADVQAPAGSLASWRATGKGHVFLTGATGFLGAFVLRDLLRMPEVVDVVCLVRASSDGDALVRIRDNMIKYGTWEDAFFTRLTPLAGDFAEPDFGLGHQRFEALSKASDVIFHLGAHVNYVQPYSAHRAGNVTGTINVLRFATAGKTTPLHFVSTIAAFGPAGLLERTAVVYEDDELADYLSGLKFDTGYSQSKWVAEQLVWEAIRRGVPAAVYRPGFIMGDSLTGAGNPSDFVARLVKGCAMIGAYPALARQGKQFVPVDYVSAALLDIASDNANLTRAYHLVPPGTAVPVDLGGFFKLLIDCGYSLDELTYQQWVQRLADDSRLKDNPLMPLVPMLVEPVYGPLTRWEVYEGMPVYDTSNTERALAMSNGVAYTPFDRVLLRRYLDYWTAIGFLDEEEACALQVGAE